MREIKFRGMLRSGEWVYGGYVQIKDGAHCILSGKCNHCESGGKAKNVLSFNAVKFKTVGEYTGLKDKNGKEIYEGDIVDYRYGDMSGGKAVVIYKDGCFEVGQGYISCLSAMSGGIEVIGNIYEGLYSGEECDIIKEWKKNTNEQSHTPSQDTRLAEKPEGKLD